MIDRFSYSLCNFLIKNEDNIRKKYRSKHLRITNYTHLIKLQILIKSFFLYLILIYRYKIEIEYRVEILIQFIRLLIILLL
jgi:hypothetical protein